MFTDLDSGWSHFSLPSSVTRWLQTSDSFPFRPGIARFGRLFWPSRLWRLTLKLALRMVAHCRTNSIHLTAVSIIFFCHIFSHFFFQISNAIPVLFQFSPFHRVTVSATARRRAPSVACACATRTACGWRGPGRWAKLPPRRATTRATTERLTNTKKFGMAQRWPKDVRNFSFLDVDDVLPFVLMFDCSFLFWNLVKTESKPSG